MTEMVAVVRSATDAEVAIEAGADRIGVKFGSVSATALRELSRRVGGRRPISLIVETAEAAAGPGIAQAIADSGADEVRLPLAAVVDDSILATPDVRVIGIIEAGESIGVVLPEPRHQPGRLGGVMVVIGRAGADRLLDRTSIAALAEYATFCREHGLRLSLSGGLEPPDVPRLLTLRPDDLCFGRALHHGGDAGRGLDAARVHMLRDLFDTSADASLPPVAARTLPPDTIFVRDWVLLVRIGAYAHEHAAPQRVRFSVEAAIAGRAQAAADMRDVVSYDLITDSIRRLTVDHVDLVETLAERIADAVLIHPRVVQVTVTVEKLDLGPGALGCRITRDKAC